ncbi:MAG TPA: SGNH/GDSL hydrolase family protein [Kofleriaceae bacterium]|jgi:lysophospholipase L1-like esterase
MVIARFVAIGDSTAEGVGDPYPKGSPAKYRGFADRLAARLAPVEYANLAVSGYTAREIRERQLHVAVAMRPDLVAVMAGMNDLIRPRFDLAAVGRELDAMHGAFEGAVIAFTLPEVADRLAFPPLSLALARRMRALNAVIRASAARHGALLIDLAAHSMGTDPRMWSADRLHGNAESHERLAVACAEALALPGDHAWWRDPLPARPAPTTTQVLAERWHWMRTYLAPWLWKHAKGRPGFDQRVAKHAALQDVLPDHG